jgi:hypothetical protein
MRARRSVSRGCHSPNMYDRDARSRALTLTQEGQSLRSAGISRSTPRYRSYQPAGPYPHYTCPRCTADPGLPEPQRDYAYLLGLYLGDGYINVVGDPRKAVWVLRIICADAWPGLLEECMAASRALHPGGKVSALQREGCTEILAWSKHWPCLFPSMVQARSMNARSSSLHGSRSLPTHSPLRSPAGSSTPTAADSLTVCDDHFAMVIAGTNIRAICSPMNRQTSCDCAGTY